MSWACARARLVPHVQGAGLLRRGTACQGVPTAIAPLKDLENLQSIHFSCSLRARGWVRGGSGAGSSPSHLGSNWRLRALYTLALEGAWIQSSLDRKALALRKNIAAIGFRAARTRVELATCRF
jgi:hypothetical protein